MDGYYIMKVRGVEGVMAFATEAELQWAVKRWTVTEGVKRNDIAIGRMVNGNDQWQEAEHTALPPRRAIR